MDVSAGIDRFQLSFTGGKVWAPYWINEPGVRSGPHNGKGSPEQLQAELDEILKVYRPTPKNAEEAQYLMLRNGLGVDCSGFVFHVLDHSMRGEFGNLADHLYFTAEEVRELSQDPVEADGKSSYSLKEVCDSTNREPAWIVNVQRLINPMNSIEIGSVGEMREGDMVYMIREPQGDHIGVVSAIDDATVTFASSDFDPVGPGGIRFHTHRIIDVERGLGGQDWSLNIDFKSVHRLKVLV